MSHRWSMLSALIATALLLYCMPGMLAHHLSSSGRTDDRLKTADSRTMVVWVTSWMEEDRNLLTTLTSAFEKQRPGLRVFLRRTDAEELYAPQAVLPDVVLHTTGDILAPQEVLLPLSQTETSADRMTSGMNSGMVYGVPLWYSPLVFSVPDDWFQEENREVVGEGERPGQAYFTLSTPVPEKQTQSVTFADVPWRKMLETGRVVSESGAGLPALLLHCPVAVREELSRLEPVMGKPQPEEAAVCTLASHGARSSGYRCMALTPSLGARARYVSLCKENEDAKAFLSFLMGEEAQTGAAGAQLATAAGDHDSGLPWPGQESSGDEVFLPNAFLMSVPAMDQLCIQHFLQGEEPVATLLRLR